MVVLATLCMGIKDTFYFGEVVKRYDVRVLNEREARAAAGILFFFAFISFLQAFWFGNFYYIKIFIITFFIDFFIRVVINPKYSPSLIIGRMFVHNQKPEYVGAPQKRFAWGIGLVLSAVMFVVIVLLGLKGPFNLLVCLFCLVLLFFETAFGICIGCKMYNWFTPKVAKHCPGGVCEVQHKEKIQKISWIQIAIVFIFLLLIFISSILVEPGQKDISAKSSSDCVVPDWAKDMGHEEMWLLHHGCISSDNTFQE